MKSLTTFEAFCLKNAAHFVAARGRPPRDRTRQQFATLPEAQAFGAGIGDGRTIPLIWLMICVLIQALWL